MPNPKQTETLICCAGCGNQPMHQFNLRPGVNAEIYLCSTCRSCLAHAMDPQLEESRFQLLKRAEAAEKRAQEAELLAERRAEQVLQNQRDAVMGGK